MNHDRVPTPKPAGIQLPRSAHDIQPNGEPTPIVHLLSERPGRATGAVLATVAMDDSNPTVTDAPVRTNHTTRPIHLSTGPPDTARRDRAESVPPAATVPRLVVRAWEVMTGNPDRVAPTDSWQQVARTMRTLQASMLPVCDEHGDLSGIIDYREIGLRCLSKGGSAATARSLIHDTPFTIGMDDLVDGIAQRMAEQKAWLLPVLDGRRLVGVIHYADIITQTAPAPTHQPEC